MQCAILIFHVQKEGLNSVIALRRRPLKTIKVLMTGQIRGGGREAEVSRIESGERQKPSPLILKVVEPHLGVSYTELMVKAGYIEEVAGNEDFAERVFRDDSGKIVSIENRYNERSLPPRAP